MDLLQDGKGVACERREKRQLEIRLRSQARKSESESV